MKKGVIIGICVAVVAVVGIGAVGIYKAVSSGGTPVEVVPVSNFSQMGMFGDSNMLYATIVADLSQEVHLDAEKIVDEVYVKEGDKVKVGDKLLSYDTTLMELDAEMYQLDGQTIDLKIQGSKNDLEKLKKVTPVAKSSGAGNRRPFVNPGSRFEDDSDDEARADMIQNVVFATTSQSGTTKNERAGTEGSTAGEETNSSETSSTQQTESETTSGEQTETPPTSAQPSTETPPAVSKVTVRVEWDHGTNGVKSHPKSVSIALMNGDNRAGIQTLSAENQWNAVFDNLDPKAEYTVKGESVEGYSMTVKESQTGVFTITYRYKEPADSPVSAVKPYEILDYKSEAYKGKGTKDNPYVFFCKDGTKIMGSFINKMLGFDEKGEKYLRKGYYAKLEIREADSLTGGFVKSIGFDGTIKVSKGYEPGITWILTSEGIKKEEADIKDPDKDQEPGDDGDDDGDIDWDDGGDFDDGYTAEELKKAIYEKEQEIKDLVLDKKENDLKVEKAKRDLEDALVKSTINGIVKSVGDASVGEIDGQAFLVLASDGGMYVKGTLSELSLDTLKKGDIVQGQGNESGVSFSATVTEISQYPSDGNNNYFGGDTNSNSSYYPFMAYIEQPKGLSNNEMAQIFMSAAEAPDANAIYLEKAYVRTENGQSYVYKVDENNKLKQQFIKTGKTFYQQFIEIKEGLTLEDKIAFPYGKNVKNGAKVKESDDTADMLM